MIIVGIDISKHKHDAHIFNQITGEVIRHSFSFKNNKSGFLELFDLLQQFNISDVRIGLESTGHYHKAFVAFFSSLGFKLFVINPMQTNRLRQAQIRITKTDKIDAIIIAQAVALQLSDPFHIPDDLILEIRQLARLRFDLAQDIGRIKNQITALIDQSFPEVFSFFKSGIFGVYSSSLLSELPSAFLIAHTRVDKLQNILSSRYDAHLLKLLANDSIGIHQPAISLHIQLFFQQLQLLNNQKRTIENHLETLLLDLELPLLSIPGISTVLASLIIGEIGNINLFDSPDKLLAFAGLDPSIYQSDSF